MAFWFGGEVAAGDEACVFLACKCGGVAALGSRSFWPLGECERELHVKMGGLGLLG